MLVSIIIPTYNRCGMVCRAIDSVLNQSYKDFELIIVDDDSTDATEYYIQNYSDPRIKYFKIKHSGVAKSRNFGVKKSQADWICFLDSDDVWRRHKLSEQLRFHDKNRECLFSQTDDVWIRNSVRVNKMKKHDVREGEIFSESLRLCLVCCSSVMIQKKLFEQMDGFDEDLPTCEDYDLWIRILARYPVGFVNKKLVTKFGGHEDQLSKKYKIMDQYRLQSLHKILSLNILNAEQKNLVQKEMDYKEGIIKKGQEKRNG